MCLHILLDPHYIDTNGSNNHKLYFSYKRKGEEYYEEGAFSFKCDKTRGVWTMKTIKGNDELKEVNNVDSCFCLSRSFVMMTPSQTL